VRLLLLGSVAQDVGRDDVGVQEEIRPGGTGACELLGEDDAEDEVCILAAIAAWYRRAQQPLLARSAPHIARDLTLLLPGIVVGNDLLSQEMADGLCEQLVFVREDGPWDHLLRTSRSTLAACVLAPGARPSRIRPGS
jgi:hypothetical protein